MSNYDQLLLKNQICFPLYALSREVIKKYYPYLEKYDLTYTKYLVLMVLWEVEEISVKELSKKLYLDSGTLTPMLKDMEKKELVTRLRDKNDERVLNVKITLKGSLLKEDLKDIPFMVGGCLNLNQDDLKTLYTILYKALNNME